MIFRRENAADRTTAHGGVLCSRRARAAVIAGVAIAAPAFGVLATAGSASAATTSQWDRVAQQESGGDWSADTGNGYYGGLQFSPSTWAAYGGTGYASNASRASKSEQIAVAEKVLAAQGPGAWPNTGSGLTRSSGVAKSSGVTRAPSSGGSSGAGATHAPSAVNRATGHDGYTVRAGDTLSSIAVDKGTSWAKLYRANTSVIGSDPNMILVGQRLAV
jgi:LysM repeat protein